MNWRTVFSRVVLFQSGSCVQNCQTDPSSEHRTTWSESTEKRKEEVEAEVHVHGKSIVAARSAEEDFSICTENDGQTGVDKLLGAVLVLGLCSAWNSRVLLFARGY